MDPFPYCPDDVVDSARLRAHGLTSHDVARLCRAGTLHQLVRGWFATRPPRDRVDRHLLTARALTRHFGGRAVPSHHSQLLAVGLPVWRADLAVVHLTRVGDRGSRRRAGFAVHPAVDGMSALATPGAAGVPVAVAIVQTGILNGPMDALIAADAALRAGLVDVPQLAAALDLFSGRTGVAPVRAALAHADARHESPGETRLAGVLRDLGVPATPQVWIRTLQGPKRVDALLDDHAVVLEFDGAVKYRTVPNAVHPVTQPTGAVGNALFEEKEREDAIRDEEFEVVRVVWRQLAEPGGIHRRILAAVARCTRRAA